LVDENFVPLYSSLSVKIRIAVLKYLECTTAEDLAVNSF
jgi:hypothetical protein